MASNDVFPVGTVQAVLELFRAEPGAKVVDLPEYYNVELKPTDVVEAKMMFSSVTLINYRDGKFLLTIADYDDHPNQVLSDFLIIWYDSVYLNQVLSTSDIPNRFTHDGRLGRSQITHTLDLLGNGYFSLIRCSKNQEVVNPESIYAYKGIEFGSSNSSDPMELAKEIQDTIKRDLFTRIADQGTH